MTQLQTEEKKLGKPKAREVQMKLVRGLLDVVVMEFLKTRPMHGYQVITNLRKQFGVYFGPSTIYPLLSAMEEKGYIKSRWDLEHDRPRKVYEITHQGSDMLSCTEDSLNNIYRQLGMEANKNLLSGNGTTLNDLASDKKFLNPQILH